MILITYFACVQVIIFKCFVLIRMLMLLIRIVLDYETSDSKQKTVTTMIMIECSTFLSYL